MVAQNKTKYAISVWLHTKEPYSSHPTSGFFDPQHPRVKEMTSKISASRRVKLNGVVKKKWFVEKEREFSMTERRERHSRRWKNLRKGFQCDKSLCGSININR